MTHPPKITLSAILVVWLIGLPWMARVSWADWPQILGVDRNGVAKNETIVEKLPEPLPIAWSYPVGQGYAGVAIADETVYLFHRLDDVERLEALGLDTGKRLWKADFPANYAGGINPDGGPRCVPLVDGDRVIVFGAAGVLHAVERKDGKPLWSRDLYDDYRANEGYFGAGSSPLAVEDRILVNVGGRAGAGIVAVSAETGKTLWTATNDTASYSSPTLIELQGKPVAVFVTRLNTVGIRPETGDLVFQFPFGRRGPTVNAATPIRVDGNLFVTSSYQVGGRLFSPAAAEQSIWENDTTLSSQYNTPVAIDGKLFGIHGREDIGEADLRCVDARSGRTLWSEDGFGVANPIAVNGQILFVTNEGELVLVAASADEYREISRVPFSANSTRALPALSNGRLLVRDNQGDTGQLYCIDLRP